MQPCTYDYSPNKLKIKQSVLSRVPSLQYINQYILQVSYIVSYHCLFYFISSFYFYLQKIPKLYECTLLKNKWLKVMILTSSEQEPEIHPMYKIIDNNKPVHSILITADQYDST